MLIFEKGISKMSNNCDDKSNKSKIKIKLIIILCILAVIITLVCICFIYKKINTATTADSSNVINAVSNSVNELIVGDEGSVYTISEGSVRELLEINKLSTVEYTYVSIVTAYVDDTIADDAEKNNIKNIRYWVCYNGTITAGIEFDKLDITVDETNRIINIIVPEAKILSTNVNISDVPLEYIFSKDKYKTETVNSEAYSLACNDLKQKAENDTEILTLARENAISAINALLEPWISQLDNQYTIEIQ